MSVKIVTDSTCYIPEDLIKKYDISVASLSICIDNKHIKETELDSASFYERLEKSDEIPTSSQPSVSEIYDIFEKNVRNKDSVVGVFISSEMSGTYSTAILAKNMILEKYKDARIEIIDSRSNSMQLGFAALAAAKAAEESSDIDTVIKAAEKNIRSSRFLFIPANLTYLKKGGRIGGASALLGNIFKIVPILTVLNGKTAVKAKVRTKKHAIAKMVELFLDDIKKYGLEDVIVHHIHCEEDALPLCKELKDKLQRDVPAYLLGSVIGVHVGPGAIGIVYCTKEAFEA